MPESIEAALEGAFGGTPAPEKSVAKAEPEAAESEAADPVEESPEVEAEGDEAPAVDEPVEEEPAAEATTAEPEYEVEVDGKLESIKGTDKVKEILQKGLHYTKNSEAVAREREAVQITHKQQQEVAAIQGALKTDIDQLQAFDARLEEYGKVDWTALYESDPMKALALREQRDQLREARTAKFNEFQHKANQAATYLKNVEAQRLGAEEQALLAKLPAWRNSETAQAESGKIKSFLQTMGYTKAEADNIGDHRHMLVARMAYQYKELMASKDQKVKQARTAPGQVRPGAQAQPNSRADFKKNVQKLREFGTKGNHRAQENLVSQMFERAFK